MSDDHGSKYVGLGYELHCHMVQVSLVECIRIKFVVFSRCHASEVLYVNFYDMFFAKSRLLRPCALPVSSFRVFVCYALVWGEEKPGRSPTFEWFGKTPFFNSPVAPSIEVP